MMFVKINVQHVVLLAWGLFVIIWALMAIGLARNNNGKYMRSSYNGALYVTGVLSIFAYIFEIGAMQSNNDIFTYIGLVVLIYGFFLALYSRIIIGRLWSFNAISDGEIVTCFPYNIIRHPIYSGQLLMCLGTSIISNNIIVFLLFFVGSYWLLYVRSVKEEEILNKATKGNYEKQLSVAGRFFPSLRIKPEKGVTYRD